MTGASIARTGPDHRATFRAATFADVLRSEWTKLRSVRSTFWALTVTVVLGVLCVSSEYSSGMIRTSLIAVPKRGRVLAAKSLVLAVATFVVGEAVSFTAFFVGQALISGYAPPAALGDPGVARAVAGALSCSTSAAAGSVPRAPQHAFTEADTGEVTVPGQAGHAAAGAPPGR